MLESFFLYTQHSKKQVCKQVYAQKNQKVFCILFSLSHIRHTCQKILVFLPLSVCHGSGFRPDYAVQFVDFTDCMCYPRH